MQSIQEGLERGEGLFTGQPAAQQQEFRRVKTTDRKPARWGRRPAPPSRPGIAWPAPPEKKGVWFEQGGRPPPLSKCQQTAGPLNPNGLTRWSGKHIKRLQNP
jgi:hypothetical protein